MKKTLLFAICIFLFFASCKKKSSDTAPSNSITATIDGVSESFNTNITVHFGAGIQGIQSGSGLIIEGTNGNADGADDLSITINSSSTVVKGNYTNSGNSGGFPSIFYRKGAFSVSDPVFYITDVNAVNPSAVTITSISNTNIQGTFSGKLIFTDGKTIKTVTDGKFNVNIK